MTLLLQVGKQLMLPQEERGQQSRCCLRSKDHHPFLGWCACSPRLAALAAFIDQTNRSSAVHCTIIFSTSAVRNKPKDEWKQPAACRRIHTQAHRDKGLCSTTALRGTPAVHARWTTSKEDIHEPPPTGLRPLTMRLLPMGQ